MANLFFYSKECEYGFKINSQNTYGVPPGAGCSWCIEPASCPALLGLQSPNAINSAHILILPAFSAPSCL